MRIFLITNIIWIVLFTFIVSQQNARIYKLTATNQVFDKQIDSLLDDYDMLQTYSDGLAITLGQIKQKCGINDTTGN